MPEQTEVEKIAEHGEFQRQNQRAAVKAMEMAKQLFQPTMKRNDFCYCGSGIKYKRCHWHSDKTGG